MSYDAIRDELKSMKSRIDKLLHIVDETEDDMDLEMKEAAERASM